MFEDSLSVEVHNVSAQDYGPWAIFLGKNQTIFPSMFATKETAEKFVVFLICLYPHWELGFWGMEENLFDLVPREDLLYILKTLNRRNAIPLAHAWVSHKAKTIFKYLKMGEDLVEDFYPGPRVMDICVWNTLDGMWVITWGRPPTIYPTIFATEKEALNHLSYLRSFDIDFKKGFWHIPKYILAELTRQALN